jgi:hypothetical protein
MLNGHMTQDTSKRNDMRPARAGAPMVPSCMRCAGLVSRSSAGSQRFQWATDIHIMLVSMAGKAARALKWQGPSSCRIPLCQAASTALRRPRKDMVWAPCSKRLAAGERCPGPPMPPPGGAPASPRLATTADVTTFRFVIHHFLSRTYSASRASTCTRAAELGESIAVLGSNMVEMCGS